MPKLWDDTIEAHRATVRDATLDAAMALVAEHGFAGVTMSAIAERTGIGRATLYKYFPDVGAILDAWHLRAIAIHLGELAAIRDRHSDPLTSLREVLEVYAWSRYGPHGHGEGFTPHGHGKNADVTKAEIHLRDLVAGIIAKAASEGSVRSDLPPEELAAFVLQAQSAAAALRSKAAVARLVGLTLDALRPH
jgi:AcrR family transcriptional regulator